MKLTALIVDDEVHARFRIKHLIDKNEGVIAVGEAKNGNEAIELIKKKSPDVVFLDIKMPDKTGFNVIEELEHHELPSIIFTTAFDEYALKAFEVYAVDYLLKPIDEDRFNKAVEVVLENKKNIQNRWYSKSLQEFYEALVLEKSPDISFEVLIKGVNRRIFPEEILYVQSEGNYCKFCMADKPVLYRSSMASLMESLSNYPFLRIHRSMAVNTRYLKRVDYEGNNEFLLKMSNDEVLRSGRSFRKNIEAYQSIISRK